MTTAYLLGAGASVESNAPTVGEFKLAMGRLLGHPDIEAPSPLIAGNEEKLEHLLNVWDKFPMWDVERFFAHCEMMHRLQPGTSDWPQPSFVANMIAATLAACLDQNEDTSGRFAYQKFAGALKTSLSSTVLSLNWDMAMETAIGSQSHIDLGAPWVLRDEDGLKNPRRRASVQLYKLHGSANWTYCPTCNRLQLPPRNVKAIMHPNPEELEHCGDPECWDGEEHSRTVGGLIPPFLDKTRPPKLQRLFSQIWRSAMTALSEADTLVIIGYSMPESDPHMQMILQNWMQQGDKTIHVVNWRRNAPQVAKKLYALAEGFSTKFVVESPYKYGFAEWAETEGPGWPKPAIEY